MNISAFGALSSPSSSLVILFIHSAFSLCFWLTYLCPKSFGFFCKLWLVCFHVLFSQLLIEFSFVFWNVQFCLYSFTLCSYLFNIPSFACTFWFISSSCIVIFPVLPFPFFFPYIFMRFSYVLPFWPVFVDFLSAFH